MVKYFGLVNYFGPLNYFGLVNYFLFSNLLSTSYFEGSEDKMLRTDRQIYLRKLGYNITNRQTF